MSKTELTNKEWSLHLKQFVSETLPKKDLLYILLKSYKFDVRNTFEELIDEEALLDQFEAMILINDYHQLLVSFNQWLPQAIRKKKIKTLVSAI